MIKKSIIFLCVIFMCFILIGYGFKASNVRAENLKEYKVYETKNVEEYIDFINQMNNSKESEIVKIVSNENVLNERAFMVTYKPYEPEQTKYKYNFINIEGQEKYLSTLESLEEKYEIIDVFSNDYRNFYITYREEI